MATTTWEQLVRDCADSYRTLTGTTGGIKIKELPTKISEYKPPKFPNGTEWTRSNITINSFNCVYNANGIWVAGSGSSKG